MRTTSTAFIRHVSIITLLALLSHNSSRAETFDDSQAAHIDYPDWFTDNPFSDLSEDLSVAGDEGKLGLMVLFTTEGCSYCELFISKSLGDPELAAMVQKHFDSVGMEIFDDTGMTAPSGEAMSVKQFAAKEGVQFSPTLLFYGKDGKRVFRAAGYQSPERFRMILDYVSGKHYRTGSFRAYIERLAASQANEKSGYTLKHDPLFSLPPYALDRRHFPAQQPLLVLYERDGCAECETLHEQVLALDEVRDILEEFEVVRLDAGDDKSIVVTPDGSRVTPAAWYRLSGFTRMPAMVMFEENGRQVLDTDALVLRQRMMNSLMFVTERAYEKGWTYQRFARSKAIERLQKQAR